MIHHATLDEIFADAASALPTDVQEHRLLAARDLPPLPAIVHAPRVVVSKVFRMHDDHRVDCVILSLERPTARLLGLAMLSQLLHQGPDEIRVLLTHPDSEMRTLLLDGQCAPFAGCRGLRIAAREFDYEPESVERFPELRSSGPDDLPVLYWTCDPVGPSSFEEWLRCDILRVSGRAPALASLAKLFLDIGNPRCTAVRVTLEGGEVAESGAELDIQLPGLGSWVDELFTAPSPEPTF
jgi:hypothetical protein